MGNNDVNEETFKRKSFTTTFVGNVVVKDLRINVSSLTSLFSSSLCLSSHLMYLRTHFNIHGMFGHTETTLFDLLSNCQTKLTLGEYQ